jgi:hypothetical protein
MPGASIALSAVAFRIIWRSVSEIFGVVSDLLYDLRQTGAWTLATEINLQNQTLIRYLDSR